MLQRAQPGLRRRRRTVRSGTPEAGERVAWLPPPCLMPRSAQRIRRFCTRIAQSSIPHASHSLNFTEFSLRMTTSMDKRGVVASAAVPAAPISFAQFAFHNSAVWPVSASRGAHEANDFFFEQKPAAQSSPPALGSTPRSTRPDCFRAGPVLPALAPAVHAARHLALPVKAVPRCVRRR